MFKLATDGFGTSVGHHSQTSSATQSNTAMSNMVESTGWFAPSAMLARQRKALHYHGFTLSGH